MRNRIIRHGVPSALVLSLFMGGASSSVWAATPPAPAKPAAPAHPAASAPAPQPGPHLVVVRGYQHAHGFRLSLSMNGLRDPEIVVVPGGMELRVDGKANFQMQEVPKLHEVEGIETRVVDDKSVLFVRYSCSCLISTEHKPTSFALDLEQRRTAAKAPASPPPAVAPSPAPSMAAPAAASANTDEMDKLRASMAEKLARLNAPPPPPPPEPAPASDADPAQGGVARQAVSTDEAAPEPTRPVCKLDFEMDGWKGRGKFIDALRLARAKAANSNESGPEMADLAEFYLGNGLAGEALAVAQAARTDGAPGETIRRLRRDADLAQLMLGRTLDPASVLLIPRADCDRQDLPLWRALSAANSGDIDALGRDAEAAVPALAQMPEPLIGLFVPRIANAAPTSPLILRAMATALRNVDLEEPSAIATRYLLASRIARARGDRIEEASFLERATQAYGIPGLMARVRLSEMRVADDTATPDDMVLLGDTARVYRDTRFGQSAAATLTEQQLRHGDYARALKTANDSIGQDHGDTRVGSQGAILASRVLRQLLVTTDAPNLPPEVQRVLLFWQYGGFATPGEKGDDIRISAGQLMLRQGMPEAALDVAHDLADASSRSVRGMMLRAAAEAQAGDPDQALSLLASAGQTKEARRAAADALVRLGKPAEAASKLEGSKDLSDQIRRADLLFEAKAWGEASDAYAVVLRDPSLSQGERSETADHYALALALAGKKPASDLRKFDGLAGRVIQALPPAPGAGAKLTNLNARSEEATVDPVTEQMLEAEAKSRIVGDLREALRRAMQIEAVLPATEPPKHGRGG